jgi:hypothetical protein
MAVEIITTVLVAATAESPAGPYDLTDLATVHDELSIPTNDTSNDSFLSRAITQASGAIANYCNRVFPVEVVQDQIYIQQDPFPWQVPGGIFPLQLSRWPLELSTPVSFTGNTHGSILVDGIASTAGLTVDDIVFASDGSIPAGTTIAQILGPNSINLSAAASSSETGLSMNTGLQVVQLLAVGEPQTLVYGTDFTIDANRGWLIRLNPWTGVAQKWEAEPVTVQYQAGYAAIPNDLNEAALRMVTARFRARGRDPVLMARDQPGQIGTERYWVGAAKGQIGSIPPEVVGIIDFYRVPVTA